MKKLQIESMQDLETIFKERSVEMTTNIRDSIQEALKKKKKTALIFEIEVEGLESSFEVSLTYREWISALENCLKHYEEWEMGDDAIDTYLLLKQLKEKAL